MPSVVQSSVYLYQIEIQRNKNKLHLVTETLTDQTDRQTDTMTDLTEKRLHAVQGKQAFKLSKPFT